MMVGFAFRDDKDGHTTHHVGCWCSVKTPVERSCCCLCDDIDLLDLHFATTTRLYLDKVLIQHPRTSATLLFGCCCSVKTIWDRLCCRLCEAIDTMDLHYAMSTTVATGQCIDTADKDECNASFRLLLFGEDVFGSLALPPMRSD
jgi:hypothetical protein